MVIKQDGGIRIKMGTIKKLFGWWFLLNGISGILSAIGLTFLSGILSVIPIVNYIFAIGNAILFSLGSMMMIVSIIFTLIGYKMIK